MVNNILVNNNKTMIFSTPNIISIIDKHVFFISNENTRKNAIDELNFVFFPDKICKFIDVSREDNNYMSIVIEYQNNYYNILAYKTDILKKVERCRKLQLLCLKKEIE